MRALGLAQRSLTTRRPLQPLRPAFAYRTCGHSPISPTDEKAHHDGGLCKPTPSRLQLVISAVIAGVVVFTISLLALDGTFEFAVTAVAVPIAPRRFQPLSFADHVFRGGPLRQCVANEAFKLHTYPGFGLDDC